MVHQVKTLSEFEEIIKSNDRVIVDFYATWCGPCRMISPKLEAMEQEFEGKCKVIKVDVDEASDVAEKYGISAMPTFYYFENGSKKDEVIGANESKLRELFMK